LEKDELWQTYAQDFDSSGGDYRYALWAHPHINKTLKIEYYDVPTNGAINGFYGINDMAYERMPDTNITFIVFVNGKMSFTDTIGLRLGWKEFNIRTPQLANVTFITSISPVDKWAHFLFNAYTYKTG
jgi:hypothetical protein